MKRIQSPSKLSAIAVLLFAWAAIALVSFNPSVASATPVKIEPEVLDPPGKGFNDPVLGPQRLAAFRFAANLWGGFFQSSFSGQTVRVGLRMEPVVGFDAIAFTDHSLEPALVSAVPVALLDNLFREDTFPGDRHGRIVFNEQTNFFLGAQGNPGNRMDFVTLTLHELGHIFGFTSFIEDSGEFFDDFPTEYDYRVEDRFGNAFVDLPAAERFAAATSGDGLFWGGPEGIAGNNGIRPNLSAGRIFREESNVIHLSNTFGPGNLLMDSVLNEGEVIRTLSAVERGMFVDLGWTLAPAQAASEPCTLLLFGIGFLTLLACASRTPCVRVLRRESVQVFANPGTGVL